MAGISPIVYPLTKIIDAQTATSALWVAPENLQGQALEWTFYVLYDHTSAAGAVVAESAPIRDYQGTWANIGTMSWAAIDTCKMLNATALYQAVRVRISSAVTSGTATVYVMAANTI